jgi:hypothetical protein
MKYLANSRYQSPPHFLNQHLQYGIHESYPENNYLSLPPPLLPPTPPWLASPSKRVVTASSRETIPDKSDMLAGVVAKSY